MFDYTAVGVFSEHKLFFFSDFFKVRKFAKIFVTFKLSGLGKGLRFAN